MNSRPLRLIVTAVLCSACGLVPRSGGGGRVESTVQVFHRITAAQPPAYLFAPQGDQEQSLEYRTYQDMVREDLARYGWREALEGERPDAVVAFQYYIDDGKARTFSIPVWGQTGIASAHTTGSNAYLGGGFSSGSSTTTYTPSYGVTGYRQVSTTVFTRRLDLIVFDQRYFDTKKPLPLFEGRVSSQGQTGILGVVMPYMLKALFADFPGVNGSVRQASYTVQ